MDILGFDPLEPLDLKVLAQAKDFCLSLPDLAPGQKLVRGYGHWPGGGLCDRDGAYNFSTVLLDSGTWGMEVTHDPRANATLIADGADYAAHTWHRNSYAWGAAIDGMRTGDPIQEHELRVFVGMIAAAGAKYGTDFRGFMPNGEPVWMTHGECAIADGYWPERIDLSFMPWVKGARPTIDGAKATGDALRLFAHRYKAAILGNNVGG